MSVAPLLSRRDRSRLATVAEIKSTALTLMRENATTDVTFTDIARAMGMTAPALYRYFDDRDALLTALIADGYSALGEALAEAAGAIGDDDVGGRWAAAAGAYRQWARSEPQQFALVLGMPVAGYTAPEEGPTTEAAKNAMDQLAGLFLGAARLGVLGPPLITEASAAIAACQAEHHSEMSALIAPATFQAMLQTWAMLHGFTCLEAYGHLDWLEPAARDALFASHVRLAALASGLPVPRSDRPIG